VLERSPGPLFVPALAVSEAARLVAAQLGPQAEVRFLGDLASGAFVVEPVAAPDWLRIAELVWRYRRLPLDTVDASIVAAAERLGVSAVATLDRGHFTAVRPAHVKAFTLVP
jgi:predicted nucleic acid-binding protein